jgi:hypothetical protein
VWALKEQNVEKFGDFGRLPEFNNFSYFEFNNLSYFEKIGDL